MISASPASVKPPDSNAHHNGTPAPVNAGSAVKPEPAAVRDFFGQLFGSSPPDSYVLVWAKRGKQSAWFPVARLDEAARHAAAAEGDVYFGVALSPQDFGSRGRCKADQARGIVGLWADIDVRGDAHKNPDLPATAEEALELARSLGVEPTLTVHSGHGLQVYWLFAEPWLFASDAERDQAQDLSRRLWAALQRRAKARGWSLDNTSDLARIFRVPGTLNYKTTTPAPARVIDTDDARRYDPGDFFALLEAEEDPEPAAAQEQQQGQQNRRDGGRWYDVAPDDVTEAARRYANAQPASVSGQHGHDKLWKVAQAVVVGFDMADAEAYQVLRQFSDRCQPPWSESELRHKIESARAKSRLPRGYLLDKLRQTRGDRGMRQRPPDDTVSGVADQRPEDIPLPPLALRLGVVRRTAGGKLTASVSVRRGALLVDEFALTSAATSRRDAARLLRARLGDDASAEGIDDALARLVAAAAEAAARPPAAASGAGLTIQSVVAMKVPEALRLVCRTERGAWSEARGGEISRSDFCSFVPGWLLDHAGAADDAPRDGAGVNRPLLLRAVKSELEVLWSDLLYRLPAAAGVELGRDSAAGRKFREAMIRLWTRTTTFEVARTVEGTNGEAVAARASLVSRVRSQFKPFKDGVTTVEPRERWREVQRAFSVWWRPHVDGNGEVIVLLALRWEVVGQIGVELPGVTDQASLTTLGERFGVTEPSPSVTTRLSGGHRLAVLTSELTAELMENPVEIEDSVTE